MQGNHPKDQHDAKVSRRKFLTRTGAGLVIASIPGKSVWARTNGLNGSIVASGQGSAFTGDDTMRLGSPGFWKSRLGSLSNLTFSSVFGGKLFGPLFGKGLKIEDPTLYEVLQSSGSGGSDNSGMGGPSNVNFHMVAMYANAYFTYEGQVVNKKGRFLSASDADIYYPVIGTTLYPDARTFAIKLYTAAANGPPSAMGTALSKMISEYGRN